MKRGCVFAHYNKCGRVSDYVIYYITELKKYINNIVFVSTYKLKYLDYNKKITSGWEYVLKNYTTYDISLIRNHFLEQKNYD